MRREAKGRKPSPDSTDSAAAYTRALRLLTVRSRGREELRRALGQRGFGAGAAAEALDRLETQGWLDDLSAARALVRSRAQRYGTARIVRELASRGFSEETIERALAGAREEQALAAAFRKLRAASAGLAAEKRRRRIWNALVRRGFEPGSISAMMKGSGSTDDIEGSS